MKLHIAYLFARQFYEVKLCATLEQSDFYTNWKAELSDLYKKNYIIEKYYYIVLFYSFSAYTYIYRRVIKVIYSNDNVYNTKISITNLKKKKRTSINANKIFQIAVILFVLFSIINCILIYNFMEILKNYG